MVGGNDTILVGEAVVVNIEDIPAVIFPISTSWQSHLEVKYKSPESPPNVISSCDQDRNIQIKPNLPSVASFISCQKFYTLHSICPTKPFKQMEATTFKIQSRNMKSFSSSVLNPLKFSPKQKIDLQLNGFLEFL